MVSLPRIASSPFKELGRRTLIALGLLLTTTMLVIALLLGWWSQCRRASGR